jgi:teichoic acid transport system permease protein
MTDTAVAETARRSDAAALAARYGLRAAGTRPSLPEYTRQLWAFRHFINAFAEARHLAAYSEARLGNLWSVLTPLVNAAVYFLVFGVLLHTKQGIHNYIAFLCTGVFFFQFTSKVVMGSIASIPENITLVRAMHFPRGCLPLAAAVAEVRQMVVTTSALLVIVLGTREWPRFSWLLIVPAILLQAVFNTGLGFAVARLGARTSDLKQLIPWIMRTWMYASGVFYSAAVFAKSLPAPLAKVMQLNPLSVYLDLARGSLIGASDASLSFAHLWILAAIWAAVAGLAGYVFFWRGEQEYGRG